MLFNLWIESVLVLYPAHTPVWEKKKKKSFFSIQLKSYNTVLQHSYKDK